MSWCSSSIEVAILEQLIYAVATTKRSSDTQFSAVCHRQLQGKAPQPQQSSLAKNSSKLEPSLKAGQAFTRCIARASTLQSPSNNHPYTSITLIYTTRLAYLLRPYLLYFHVYKLKQNAGEPPFPAILKNQAAGGTASWLLQVEFGFGKKCRRQDLSLGFQIHTLKY